MQTIIECGQVRIARPRNPRGAWKESERARPQGRRIAGRGIRARAVRGARAARVQEVQAGLLSDGRVGLSRSAARAGYSVLPRGFEAGKTGKGRRRARERPPDHDVHAPRGGACVQLRVSPLHHAGMAAAVRSVLPTLSLINISEPTRLLSISY